VGLLGATVSGSVYLVSYDENAWKASSDELRRAGLRVWNDRARANGCRMVTLRLVPDELFPMHGNDKAYIALTEPVLGVDVKEVTVSTLAYANIDPRAWETATTAERKQELRDAAMEAGRNSGCDRWYVMLGRTTLDQGKRDA
jgi:hypothetical protein